MSAHITKIWKKNDYHQGLHNIMCLGSVVLGKTEGGRWVQLPDSFCGDTLVLVNQGELGSPNCCLVTHHHRQLHAWEK